MDKNIWMVYNICAAGRLYICDKFQESYGHCSLFSSFEIKSHEHGRSNLTHQSKTVASLEEADFERHSSFIIPESFVALAAHESLLNLI